ncbi:outer membrane beta-barrel protein [Fibrella forsythiae]|uniref:Outer membrane beta-barrel protein n=1 Tax=Fibrella forsythiae TaxID=2817061 RepID=A0ABS3JS70_9BACT|nr:outer membrane beta-barrel protein [Fibrella forsythiae]MBO0952823.1 outer membrane beta-barrel protein [Fibrella forsythiae]
MKNSFLPLLAIACLTIQFACAQSTPTRTFMIGPTIGFNKTNYVDEEFYMNYTLITVPPGVYGGVDASYQLNHWLIGAKLLYEKRTNQVSTPIPEYIIDPLYPNPARVFRADYDYNVITMPLSVGYSLTAPTTRLQWYVGGNVAFEYVAATGRQTVFSSTGISTSDNATATPRVNLGYGLQTTLRYTVTPQVVLQLEPTARYNPAGNHQIRDSYQFRGAFSVLVKL